MKKFHLWSFICAFVFVFMLSCTEKSQLYEEWTTISKKLSNQTNYEITDDGTEYAIIEKYKFILRNFGNHLELRTPQNSVLYYSDYEAISNILRTSFGNPIIEGPRDNSFCPIYNTNKWENYNHDYRFHMVVGRATDYFEGKLFEENKNSYILIGFNDDQVNIEFFDLTNL